MGLVLREAAIGRVGVRVGAKDCLHRLCGTRQSAPRLTTKPSDEKARERAATPHLR